MNTPIYYLPHGGGPLPLLDDPQHRELSAFLRALGGRGTSPAALLVVSAHWEETLPTLNTGAAPGMLFDYYGFPPESYRFEYPAPGAPALASRVAGLLREAGLDSLGIGDRGYDHGVFVPLLLMYPQASIPVLQLSLVRGLDPRTHLQLGQALAPLREEGVAIIGSGMSFHNLPALFAPDNPTLATASDAFDAWLRETLCGTELTDEVRLERLAQWQQAPHARFCHPREEHLLPLHVCCGAAGGARAEVLFNAPLMGHRVSGFGWY